MTDVIPNLRVTVGAIALTSLEIKKIEEVGSITIRRVIERGASSSIIKGSTVGKCADTGKVQYVFIADSKDRGIFQKAFTCPYGEANSSVSESVGDLLWVSESHRPIAWDFEDGTVKIQYSDKTSQWVEEQCNLDTGMHSGYDYMIAICDELEKREIPKSDGTNYDISIEGNLPTWRVAPKMPRWASRLLVELVKTDLLVSKDHKGLSTTEWVLKLKKH